MPLLPSLTEEREFVEQVVDEHWLGLATNSRAVAGEAALAVAQELKRYADEQRFTLFGRMRLCGGVNMRLKFYGYPFLRRRTVTRSIRKYLNGLPFEF